MPATFSVEISSSSLSSRREELSFVYILLFQSILQILHFSQEMPWKWWLWPSLGSALYREQCKAQRPGLSSLQCWGKQVSSLRSSWHPSVLKFVVEVSGVRPVLFKYLHWFNLSSCWIEPETHQSTLLLTHFHCLSKPVLKYTLTFKQWKFVSTRVCICRSSNIFIVF